MSKSNIMNVIHIENKNIMSMMEYLANNNKIKLNLVLE